MNQDLILLGLLRDGPKHGYELKKIIDSTLGAFAGVGSKSVYYCLKGLEKRNLIFKTVGKEGRRPEKYIYRLTPKGENEFSRLLNKNLLVIERPSLNIDLSLYFFKFMQPESVIKRLKSRLVGLEKIKEWMNDLENSIPSGEHSHYLAIMAQHSSKIAKVEIDFTKKLIKTIPLSKNSVSNKRRK